MGVDGMGAYDIKCLGDHPTIINIKLKQRQKLIDDSIVITCVHSEDQGYISLEVRCIDLSGGYKCTIEGPDDGNFREVNVVLPKGVSVFTKVIEKCFKTRRNYAQFWRGSNVDPTKFGAYRAVKMLMEHCFNLPSITTEDKDALRKGLLELETNCVLLNISDLVRFFPERATLISIDLMERPVDSIAMVTDKPLGKLLMHFLVVLTFNPGISIVVEKLKRPSCNRNVGIGRLVGLEKITSRIPLIKLIGVEVQVQQLEDLMKELDTEYDIWRSNCWGFGNAFAKAVVELLIVNVAADSPDKDNLNHGLENLIQVERPSPYRCFRLFTCWAVFDDKNNDTQRRWENRLEDHLKNCPNCHVHKQLMKALKKRTDVMIFLQSLAAKARNQNQHAN